MLKLSGMFHDGAVFQRQSAIPVWGRTTPETIVRAELNGCSAMTQSRSDGSFQLHLPPMEAAGPCELTVSAGTESTVLHDIYIGEVWLAAGQSNMEFTLKDTDDHPDWNYRNPLLRFYRVPMAARVGGAADAAGRWEVALPEHLKHFSAVAFHFARRLQQALGIAVGVIDTSYGGTNIAAWLSAGALSTLPFYQQRLAMYHCHADRPEEFSQFPDPVARHDRGGREAAFVAQRYQEAKTPPFTERGSIARDWHRAEFDDSQWRVRTLPDAWDDAGEHQPGVFWFRREVSIPAAWTGRDLVLSLGAIDQQDECFVNGEKVGATGSGWAFSSFEMRSYPVPGRLVAGTELSIAIRDVCFLRTVLDVGVLGPETAMQLSCPSLPGETISLAGAWRQATERLDGATVSGIMMQTNGAGEAHSLHMMFDNMIRPVIPYALRGFLWYQGEADSTELELAQRYRETLCALRADWRRSWGNPELEFLIVQLPGFQRITDYQQDAFWSLTREAQLLAALDDGTYPAVLTDQGDTFELHGRSKRVAGERLAALTLKKRQMLEAADPGHGPVAGAVERIGRQLRVSFSATGGGLHWSDGDTGRTWQIAGADGIPHPAQAQIEAPNRVLLCAPEVEAPLEVYYGWSMNPQRANLVNAYGYPASPFRARATERLFTLETEYLDSPLVPGRVRELFVPERVTQSTAIFMVHGGGWRGGSRAGYHRIIEEFTRLGFVVGNTDYRLDAPDAFAQVVDIRDSYDRFITRLRELGRPLKVMFYGESAGAHLALLTAMTPPGGCGEAMAFPGFRRVNEWVAPVAIAVQAAPVTLEPWEDIFPPVEQMFRDITPGDDPERRRRLSPISYIGNATPRVFFLNAANEHMFPLEFTGEFQQRMRRAGRDCRIALYPNAEHGFLYELVRHVQRRAFDDLADYAINL